MSDDIPEEVKVAKELGFSQIVPEAYKDLIQPAAKELGKGLEVTAKAVNLALSPIQGMVWGAEKIKAYLTTEISNRLKAIPPEQIVTPNPSVAGPTIEALKFSGHIPELRNLFANLLASSMNYNEASKSHPAFVEVIKQISSDEAKILEIMASHHYYPLINSATVTLGWHSGEQNKALISSVTRSCKNIDLDNPELIPTYIDNLRRLQLIEITHEYKDDMANRLDSTSLNMESLEWILTADKERIEELKFTNLGQQFIEICIKPTGIQR